MESRNADGLIAVFHGRPAVAELKLEVGEGGGHGSGRFPRSPSRGRIEARGGAMIRYPTLGFPRSPSRGRIEACNGGKTVPSKTIVFHGRPAVAELKRYFIASLSEGRGCFPRSPSRGRIEAH